MSEQHYSADSDLKEAQAMVDALGEYLLSKEIYGRVGGGGLFGGGKMPALTIGALLMRLRRLRTLADSLTPAQRDKLAAIEAKHEGIRKEWRLHYDEKAVREAHSRLDAIKHFFEECANDPRLCANVYLPEALRRTVVQELSLALADSYADTNELPEKMRGTDSRLKRYTQPTDFIWDKALEPVYPRDQFSWLYARPPVPTKE
jgi:hypothetical protein